MYTKKQAASFLRLLGSVTSLFKRNFKSVFKHLKGCSFTESLLYCVVSRLRVAVSVNKTPTSFNRTLCLTAYIACVAVVPAVDRKSVV